jgi:hypothetical protein
MESLYEVVAAILHQEELDDIPVIFEGQNGIRPKAPFLSIMFRVTVGRGNKNDVTPLRIVPSPEGLDPEVTLSTTRQPIRRSMTMFGFGQKAMDVLETVKNDLRMDEWIDELALRHLTIPQMFEVQEAPEFIDVVQEAHASFDFDLTYIRVKEMPPEYIENLELAGTYVDGEKIVRQEDFNE